MSCNRRPDEDEHAAVQFMQKGLSVQAQLYMGGLAELRADAERVAVEGASTEHARGVQQELSILDESIAALERCKLRCLYVAGMVSCLVVP